MNGRILWANLHLLFWLSLIPFGTAWMGENNFASIPVATYGVVLLAAAIAAALRGRHPDRAGRAVGLVRALRPRRDDLVRAGLAHRAPVHGRPR